MKLYEVPKNSLIKFEDELYRFIHLDGAYSLCTDGQGNTVHLAAWSEVEVLEEGVKK